MAKRYAFSVKASVWEAREPAMDAPVVTPAAIFKILRDVGTFAQEAFFVLTFNNKCQLIDKYMVSLGTLTASLVHPREVFRPAIADGAASVAVAHNHPSGNPAPSVMDRELTTRLLDASKILGIQLLDHVIVGRDSYYSFQEVGLM